MSSSISNMMAITPCKTIRGHTQHVRGVVHLPDGRRIITGSDDGSLRLWELESGAQVGKDWRDEEDKTLVRAIALSPNGTAVASGGSDGKVRLWDVETGKVVGKWTAHTDAVASVCWSIDGKRVLSASGDASGISGAARVWDIKNSRTILEIKTGSDDGSCHVAIYSPDSLKIATLSRTAGKIWDAKTGELLSRVSAPPELSSVVWMSDGKKLIGGSMRSIMIFDTSNLQKIATLEGHKSWVHVIALSRNERLLASASWDHTAHLWNLDTNLPVGPPLEHERAVLCAAFSADGKLLVTGCEDHNVYVWDLHAILDEAGLKDLLSIPDVPAGKSSMLNNKATRQPGKPKDFRGVPLGFFDEARDRDHSSTARSTHHHSSRAPSSSLRNPRALLDRVTSLFRRSHSHTGEATELQQRPRKSVFSRRGPRTVEVATVQDRKPLAVAPRPENRKQQRNQTHGQGSSSQHQAAAATSATPAPGTTTTGAPTVRSRLLTLLARLVLFLCCAYPPCSNSH